MPEPDRPIVDTLRRLRLVEADATPAMTPLGGGVSSDIWRVDLPAGPVCVKRALARLKVDAVWEAPVERNRYEWAWMQVAARVDPAWVPPLVAQDPQSNCLVMGFLDPATHPLWKAQLRRGEARERTARQVGTRLAAIHRATAGRADLRERFDTGHIFHAIRLEPYLLATAQRHPDLRPRLAGLAAATAETRLALVHGDLSPKNILVGPGGPVFLRRRVRVVRRPRVRRRLLPEPSAAEVPVDAGRNAAFPRVFRRAGRRLKAGGLDWERPSAWKRGGGPAARPAAGQGGRKSPVEYVTTDRDRNLVRGVARRLLREPVATLAAVQDAWASDLSRDFRQSRDSGEYGS